MWIMNITHNHPKKILLVAVMLGLTAPAWAHPLGEVVQETRIKVDVSEIVVEYHTRVGPSITFLLHPDSNDDDMVMGDEELKLYAKVNKIISRHLVARIDNRDVKLKFAYGSFSPLSGGLIRAGMVVTLYYSIDLDDIPAGTHCFSIRDDNFRAGELSRLRYLVDGASRVKDMELSENGRILGFRFSHAGAGSARVQGRSADNRKDETTANSAESSVNIKPGAVPAVAGDQPKTTRELSTLTGFVQRKKLGMGIVALALVMALLLGAVHALSPGHGKAMVAAYLVGTSGRVRDAVYLGGIVTFTHVISVVLLGLGVLLLSEFVVPQVIAPWLGVVSGGLVFCMGYWMLARKALGLAEHYHAHDHAHEHDHHTHEQAQAHAHSHVHEGCHDHDHEHDHDQAHSHSHGPHSHTHVPQGKISLGSLLSLGIAGGMVPCPTALVVLLAAVAMQRIAFGLLLIIAFSLGLAAVLILIGILAVTASKFTERFSSGQKWIQHLPVFSAGVVMLVGVSITVKALLAAGVL